MCAQSNAQPRAAGPADSGGPPLGLAVVSAAKILSRGFAEELAAAGGSLPVWVVVLALEQRRWRTQQDLAAAVGIEGPTLTHHLDRLEKAGVIERSRDPDDRRAIRVELTPAGDALSHRLAKAAESFDKRLRAGLTDDELDGFRDVLNRLRENVRA